MKKLDPQRRISIIKLGVNRHSRNVLLRKQRRRARLLKQTESELNDRPRWVTIYNQGVFERAALRGEPQRLPSILSLADNYEETVEFLADLRRQLVDSWRKSAGKLDYKNRRQRRAPLTVESYWPFENIIRISPDVALIVASEYDRIRRNNGWIPRAINLERWKPSVFSMLEGIGFFELCGVTPSRGTVWEGTGWRALRFRSSDNADGQPVAELLSSVGIDEILNDPELYDAIVEAITNTKHHAYPSNNIFEEPHVPSWWLTAFVDIFARRVRISVFDQGVSIPATLQSWKKYRLYERGYRRMFRVSPDVNDPSRDGPAIALAMAVGRTSTGKSYRGRGLPAIEAAIDLCRTGRLSIYSRCGQYERETGRRPTYGTRNAPIGGTLITWDLHL